MQTVLSPAQEAKISIEKLIKIPVEKIKEKLLHLGSEERIRYAGTLFEGNGWTVAYHKKGQQADTILLSYPKAPDNIVLMVRLDVREQELSYEEVREHLLYFENELAPQYQCRQFCLVGFNGYESKAEHLEDFNLLLQKWSYIEELHLNYSSDKIREPRIQLFAHNKQTYKKVQRMMQQTNAVAVVQATGTGKSYLIAKLLQDFNGTKRLVMAPSTFIIEQIKEHIRWEVDKIQFMTYAKGMNLSESEIKSLQPGMIVLDEFHRCGAEEWGRGVQNIINAYPTAFKFGTSATPIRYLDNRRDMAKELFEGNIAENLSLAQAITRNILPMPKYVCALYTLKEEADNLRELIKKSRKNEEAKQKILLELDTITLDWERSHGIPQVLKKHWRKHMGKFIVFCENEEHLLETEPMVVGWFKEATENLFIKIYRVHQGESECQKNLEAFKNASEKEAVHLLFSINMLNEGLHVNEVSGVVLLRPTESPNIFYQQIGRCLKVGASHTPVIFDFVNNFKSVRTHDFMYDLQEAKRFYTETRKEQELKDLCPEFSIIDEVREITEVFGEIEFKVQDWDAMYERLVEFKQRFGHCTVPSQWKEDKYLAYWVLRQRKRYKEGLLEEQQVRKLTEIGIEWKIERLNVTIEDTWMKNFEALGEFRKLYGHFNVIEKYQSDKRYRSLRFFMDSQRTRYKLGTLEEYRIKKLESIGFEWNSVKLLEGLWQQRFDELVAFKNQYGHCIVPTTRNRSVLSKWVSTQRAAFKKNTIDSMRKQKLDSIGFVWDTGRVERTWEESYQLLADYYLKHGTSLVKNDKNDKQHHELAKWCTETRIRYKKGKLSREQIEKLKLLDFKWNAVESQWEERYAALAAFKEKYGHTLLPKTERQYHTLRLWCGTQRQNRKNDILTPEKIKRLDALGFMWNVPEAEWHGNYEKLKSIIQSHSWNELPGIDQSLAYWVSRNRKTYQKGNLSDDKVMLLNKLGIEWSPAEQHWDKMYRQLAEYRQKTGKSYASFEHNGTPTLANWCLAQRNNYRKNKLSPEQVRLLSEIEFPWEVKGVREMQLWNAKYQELLKYRAKYGRSYDKAMHKEHKELGEWCHTQRRNYNKNKLTAEQVKLLNDIEFPWNKKIINMPHWQDRYNELLTFKEKFGTSYLPADKRSSYYQLALWCSTQRHDYRENKLLPQQIQLLNTIGFRWEINTDPLWNSMYEELVKFREKHGRNYATVNEKGYETLGRWCSTQRGHYRKNRLHEERIRLLNDIGFPWETKSTN